MNLQEQLLYQQIHPLKLFILSVMNVLGARTCCMPAGTTGARCAARTRRATSRGCPSPDADDHCTRPGSGAGVREHQDGDPGHRTLLRRQLLAHAATLSAPDRVFFPSALQRGMTLGP